MVAATSQYHPKVCQWRNQCRFRLKVPSTADLNLSICRRSSFSDSHCQRRHRPDLGDRGGNEVDVSPATGEKMTLHAYWDGMFGGNLTVDGAIFDSFVVKKVSGIKKNIPKLLLAPEAKASISDPEAWLNESHLLARQFAYA